MSQIFENPLPGVPSVESPFFTQIFEAEGVDPEIRRIARDLHHNGFAIIDFPDTEFDQLAERIKEDLRDQYKWDYWFDEGYNIGDGLRIQDAWKFNDDVKRIATNSHILHLLKKLFGRHAWPFQTLNFPVGTQQHMHTDAVHFSSAPERFMCGVWTAFEDIGEDAGPLLYYPGSHKWPIFTNEHIGICATHLERKPTQSVYESMWRALVDAHGVKPQTFRAKKGQALIWLANLLHGGTKQLDKTKTRWSQVTHYYFEDCAYYTPMWSDPFYGNIAFRELPNIVTGEITRNAYLGKQIPIERVGSAHVTRGLPADFDAELYFAANPDVRAAGVGAEEHYLAHGWREMRSLRP
ncbi:phytanoyl-CoA dioxygenase family protein [Burkholderia cenocepacia]|uniref:phytanoyl-CoA dioxygenase family protein n=1 Tax=Burkholderia cenocepacia TaxID=95486 RepID=UPI001B970BF5|nr:phytanoyl-CoA dioxygenase family protein [Burkholderia cenocepacia]MBR8197915.1 phytanoyl-CoA dioxygenase family protein [Burkholderia cenocepacia]MBR8295759.1 phytanoyl-CoA dioxygenase family protein [Burkholderia cenocepacia]HDV6326894.1 phytanoyl-CoA dioxygenase family protein [Burkholderia cenocepacia]HDV6353252.1 phytanoyl-CoA dioxygenase family protein [Burkholderia cenocepacia]